MGNISIKKIRNLTIIIQGDKNEVQCETQFSEEGMVGLIKEYLAYLQYCKLEGITQLNSASLFEALLVKYFTDVIGYERDIKIDHMSLNEEVEYVLSNLLNVTIALSEIKDDRGDIVLSKLLSVFKKEQIDRIINKLETVGDDIVKVTKVMKDTNETIKEMSDKVEEFGTVLAQAKVVSDIFKHEKVEEDAKKTD